MHIETAIYEGLLSTRYSACFRLGKFEPAFDTSSATRLIGCTYPMYYVDGKQYGVCMTPIGRDAEWPCGCLQGFEVA